MKKSLFLIIGIFLLIFIILILALISIQSKNKLLSKVNREYEYYLNRKIYGTELATLINKAMENNKKMEVEKDKNGFYLDNGKDSIIITIDMYKKFLAFLVKFLQSTICNLMKKF